MAKRFNDRQAQRIREEILGPKIVNPTSQPDPASPVNELMKEAGLLREQSRGIQQTEVMNDQGGIDRVDFDLGDILQTADRQLKAPPSARRITPTQTVGAQAVSSGLQTIAHAQNVNQQVADAKEQIAFEAHQRDIARREAEVGNILNILDNLDRQAQSPAGSQTQLFLRDPATGRAL